MTPDNFEKRILDIEERNWRVSYDKAWETSWTRRGIISGIIYGCGFILLTILGHDGAWKHATVPVMGYLVSTFSLPMIKARWIARRENKKGLGNVTIH